MFYNHVIRRINNLTFLLFEYGQELKILDKNHRKMEGYTNENVYISATECPRGLKLVSNDCYDNILYPENKIYKQAYFLVPQIFKTIYDIGEKSLPKEGGIPIKLHISQ